MTYKRNLNREVVIALFHQVPNLSLKLIYVMNNLARDGGEGVRYAMVAINNLIKMAEVIAIDNRQPI